MSSNYLPIYQKTTIGEISVKSLQRQKRLKVLLVTMVILAILTISGIVGLCAYYFSGDGTVNMTTSPPKIDQTIVNEEISLPSSTIGFKRSNDEYVTTKNGIDTEVTTEIISTNDSTATQNINEAIDKLDDIIKKEQEEIDDLNKILHGETSLNITTETTTSATTSSEPTVTTTETIFTPKYDIPASWKIPDEFKNHKNFHKFDLKNCGKTGLIPKSQYGEIANITDYPWMVALFSKNKTENFTRFKCGGSLIAKNLVLTASHCIPSSDEVKLVQIRLGDEYLGNDNGEGDDEDYGDLVQKDKFPVQNIHSFTTHVHPNYDGNTKENDIAIIKLNEPANIEQVNINTVCLPFMNKNLPMKIVLTGFGIKEHRIAHSDELTKATMNVISAENCTKSYSNRVTDDQFCATKVIRRTRKLTEKEKATTTKPSSGTTEENVIVDSCEGDSGSPAVYPVSSSQQVQYGLVSWGENRDCGADKLPGVYVKVYSYLEWILDQAA